MRYKIGQVQKFLSPKHDYFTIKDIVEDPDVKLIYEFDGGVCPDCKKKCKITRAYDFKRIYVLENKDGFIGYKGETADGELVRMPDESFYSAKMQEVTDKVKLKSKYLKEK